MESIGIYRDTRDTLADVTAIPISLGILAGFVGQLAGNCDRDLSAYGTSTRRVLTMDFFTHVSI